MKTGAGRKLRSLEIQGASGLGIDQSLTTSVLLPATTIRISLNMF